MAGLRVIRTTDGIPMQALTADHAAHLGTSSSNSDMSVAASAATNSIAAPRNGCAVVTLPPNTTCRYRVGASAVAVATDHLASPGPNHWPIKEGERVSLFGNSGATTFVATASLVMADGAI